MRVLIRPIGARRDLGRVLRADVWSLEGLPGEAILAGHPRVADEEAARARLNRLGLLSPPGSASSSYPPAEPPKRSVGLDHHPFRRGVPSGWSVLGTPEDTEGPCRLRRAPSHLTRYGSALCAAGAGEGG